MSLRERVFYILISGLKRLDRTALQHGGYGWRHVDLGPSELGPNTAQLRAPQTGDDARARFELKGIPWWRGEFIWGNDENHTLMGVIDIRDSVEDFLKSPKRDELELIAGEFIYQWRRRETEEFKKTVERILQMEILSDEEMCRILNESLTKNVHES